MRRVLRCAVSYKAAGASTGIVNDHILVLHARSSPQVSIGAILDGMSAYWWRAPLPPNDAPTPPSAAVVPPPVGPNQNPSTKLYKYRPIEWSDKWMETERCAACQLCCGFAIPIFLRSALCSCNESVRNFAPPTPTPGVVAR